jgi:hypothetical protein
MSNEIEFIIDKSGTIREYKGKGGEVIIPPEINGIPIRSISKGVFQRKKLTKVKIPENVETILDYFAFSENELNELVLPHSLKVIGYSAFSDNKLTKVELSENLRGISSLAFFRNLLINIVIPDNVRVINENAFAENPIREITIGNDVLLGYHSEYYITHESGKNSFDNDFDDYYKSEAKKAGTYLFDGKKWNKSK